MSNQEQPISDELGAWIVAEYEAAFELYKNGSNKLIRPGSKNFYAACEVLKGGGLTPDNFHRTAFLSALAQVAAAGNLDRDRTEAEKAEIQLKRNLENERRDRFDGNVGTHRGHGQRAQAEAELDRLEANPEDVKAEIRRLVEVAKKAHEAEELNKQERANVGPGDALIALQSILDPVGVGTATRDTQRAIERWIRTSDTKHYRSVRQTHPDLATKMDRIMSRNIIED